MRNARPRACCASLSSSFLLFQAGRSQVRSAPRVEIRSSRHVRTFPDLRDTRHVDPALQIQPPAHQDPTNLCAFRCRGRAKSSAHAFHIPETAACCISAISIARNRAGRMCPSILLDAQRELFLIDLSITRNVGGRIFYLDYLNYLRNIRFFHLNILTNCGILIIRLNSFT